MRRAILVAGFNNWGKSALLRKLFHAKRFQERPYKIPTLSASFVVQQYSNDDYNEREYLKETEAKLQGVGGEYDLFSTLCPTRDGMTTLGQGTNDSKRILQSPLFGSFDEVHVFLQKHKWDFHAELRVDDIRRYLGRVPKVTLHVVDADGAIPNGRDQARTDATREQARHDQLLKKLRRIYP